MQATVSRVPCYLPTTHRCRLWAWPRDEGDPAHPGRGLCYGMTKYSDKVTPTGFGVQSMGPEVLAVLVTAKSCKRSLDSDSRGPL